MASDATELGRENEERAYGATQAAILGATEQLLVEHPLNELSVADIIAAAGISRTSFYVYFASKTAVIAECLRRVLDEAVILSDPFRSGSEADPEAAIHQSLERWVALCSDHGALLRAVMEEWPHDEELRRLWFRMLGTVTDATAKVIRSARRRGQAPPGADADALAACLMWAYERVLHVTLVGDARGLPGPEVMTEPLSQMVVGGIFGQALAAPGPTTELRDRDRDRPSLGSAVSRSIPRTP
jgi:TetR/AcrR family transcriptional regulator, ethionamide resistance regulator